MHTSKYCRKLVISKTLPAVIRMPFRELFRNILGHLFRIRSEIHLRFLQKFYLDCFHEFFGFLQQKPPLNYIAVSSEFFLRVLPIFKVIADSFLNS